MVRGRDQKETRPERQVRSARACQLRNRPQGRGARHAAAILRAGVAASARHGQPRRRGTSTSRRLAMPMSPARARATSASTRSPSTRRPSTPRRTPISRCSCTACSIPSCEETPKLRLHLFDHRNADARGALPHGARRRPDRLGRTLGARQDAGGADDDPRGKRVQGSGAAVQPRIAQAARRNPLRQNETAGAEEDGDRQAIDRRGCPAATRGRLSAPQIAARASRLVEAQVDLYGQAAADGQRTNGTCPHLLRPGDGRHRPTREHRA